MVLLDFYYWIIWYHIHGILNSVGLFFSICKCESSFTNKECQLQNGILIVSLHTWPLQLRFFLCQVNHRVYFTSMLLLIFWVPAVSLMLSFIVEEFMFFISLQDFLRRPYSWMFIIIRCHVWPLLIIIFQNILLYLSCWEEYFLENLLLKTELAHIIMQMSEYGL